eukprot:10211714-Alexandrium_andersonii.AAC.1
MLGAQGTAGLERFWRHVQDHKWVQDHPHIDSSSDYSACIPIRFHGDATRAFKVQKLLCLSWGPMGK